MKEKPLITITIPTYNRAKYLVECLDSIINQFEEEFIDDISIEIFNNGSTDNTLKSLEKYASYDNIYIYSNDSNIGADRNFQRCMYDSNGEFVFLMSDDDILLPGALKKIYFFVKENPHVSLIHLNSKSFQGKYSESVLSKKRLSDSSDVITTSKEFFIERTNIWITFMSCLIFNRKSMIEKESSSQFFGTYFIQSHIALLNTRGNSSIGILVYPSVGARGGNSGGYKFYHVWSYNYKKLLLETGVKAGYNEKTMKKIFIDSTVKTISRNILSIKTDANNYELDSAWILFKNTYKYFKIWLFVYPIAFTPAPILKVLRKIVKLLKK